MLDLTEIQCDMSDVNLKYEKLGGLLQEPSRKAFQAVLSRMQKFRRRQARCCSGWNQGSPEAWTPLHLQPRQTVSPGWNLTRYCVHNSCISILRGKGCCTSVPAWAQGPEKETWPTHPAMMSRVFDFQILSMPKFSKNFLANEIRSCYKSDWETKARSVCRRRIRNSPPQKHQFREWGLIFYVMV